MANQHPKASGKPPRRRSLLAAACLLGLPLAAAAQDAARDYPSKTITLIVPYAAGGSSDVRARQIAQKISVTLGQSVIVDYKPGANGNIGTNAIAKAAPDGHVIGLGNLAPLAVNKTLMPNTPFDPATDLVPVILLEKGPLVLVVNAEKSPHKSLKDLIGALKAAPGKMSYASAGSGGSFHMAGEMFKSSVGASAVHIPYRGGGPMMTALLGNEIPMMFINQDVALPHIKAGKLRPLAVSSLKRNNLYPDVPTVAESGYPGFEALSWSGMSVAAGTPAPIVAKLEAAFNEVMGSAAIKTKLESNGFVVPPQGSKVYSDFVAAEKARWTQVIQKAGIKPQ